MNQENEENEELAQDIPNEVLMPKLVGGLRGPKLKGPTNEAEFQILENLLKIQCSLEECAAYWSVDVKTIQNRIEEWYGMKFSQLAELKRNAGRISIRRVQYQKALKGNIPMLIWLGKQYLGQRDKYEHMPGDEDSLENSTLEKIQQEIDNRQSKFTTVKLKNRTVDDFETNLINVTAKNVKTD